MATNASQEIQGKGNKRFSGNAGNTEQKIPERNALQPAVWQRTAARITDMRIRATTWKDNHLLRDHTITDLSDDTRTHKVFHALDEACAEFDLAHPQWLESVVREFQRHSRCRFRQDCFVGEDVPFDYLELQVLEED